MENVNPDASNVNPIALLFLLLMGLVVWQGSRRSAVQAFLATAAFLPLGQQIVVFGLHFQFFRILILTGLLRAAARGEVRGLKINAIDKLFIIWALTVAICGALRDPSAIFGLRCLGGAFNAFGTYFLIRILIRDLDDVIAHVRFLSLAAILIAIPMAWENFAHKNVFSVFGGVPDLTDERAGRFRCQGPFEHPILAGTFAATLLPLLVGLWFTGSRHKVLAFGGIIACVFCSYAAASSGALMTCVTALAGLFLWSWRLQMRWVRRGMLALLVGAALVMKAPFWYIIARLSDQVGGTGWHRAYLIDQAIGHFSEWWLVGTSVTAHWAPSGQVLAVDPNSMDITNNYIAQGIQGGLLGLCMFVAIIIGCFRVVGHLVRRHDLPIPHKLIWAFGVSLACHCIAMISISYFDQIQVFWFWLLAVFATLSVLQRRRVAAASMLERAPAASSLSGIPTAPPVEIYQ